MSKITKSACLLNLENGPILKRSIERLLQENTEVLVVDNNSHDNTKEVLQHFKNKIQYWIWDEIKGQSFNRNWMIKHSHGKYILLLDSDILYFPGSFDYLIKRLQNSDEHILNIGFNPWNYTNKESEADNQLPPLDALLEHSGFAPERTIALTQYGVFDRDLFDKYNIWFDEGFGTGYGAEDNDFAMQMEQKGLECRMVSFKYYHNKMTEHWHDIHNNKSLSDTITKRQRYFQQKWGLDTYNRYYKQSIPPDNPKVAIGVGICPRTEYARDLWQQWYKRQTYKNVIPIIDENSGEENARASRQRIRDRFMKTDAQYLLFTDVDTIPPDNAIQMLLSRPQDIITGLATARTDEKVLAFWRQGYPKQQDKVNLIHDTLDDLIPIDGAGLYCSLVSRRVLEKIKFDWDSIVDDIEFYKRARQLGFRPYLNKKVLCKHYYNSKQYNFPQI